MTKFVRKRAKGGFTLVELIVVLVIIAILAAIAIPSMMKYVQNTKYAQAQAGIHNTRTAVSATLLDAAKDDLIGQLGLVSKPGSVQAEHPIVRIRRGVPSTEVVSKRFSQYVYDGLKKRLEEDTDLADYDIYFRLGTDYSHVDALIVCYLDPNDRSKNLTYVEGETFKKWFGEEDFIKNANTFYIDYIMN